MHRNPEKQSTMHQKNMPVVPLLPEFLFLRKLQWLLRTPVGIRLKISSNENLLFTTSGDRLPPVIVSCDICFYLSHWGIIQWCSECRDGGDLAVCTTCNIIGICSVCIDFGMKDGFVCPPCFERARKLVSYVCFWFNFLLTNIYLGLAMEIPIPWCRWRKLAKDEHNSLGYHLNSPWGDDRLTIHSHLPPFSPLSSRQSGTCKFDVQLQHAKKAFQLPVGKHASRVWRWWIQGVCDFNIVFLKLIFQSGGLGSWLLLRPTLFQNQGTCTQPQTIKEQHLLIRSGYLVSWPLF